MIFKSNTTSLFSRIIDGNYPNVTGILPKNSKTKRILETKQLLKGIDRARLFASEWEKNHNVHMEIIDDTRLMISSSSAEIGRIEETQAIKGIEGDLDLSITLDGCFLMDALKAIKEEEISLSFSGSMSAVLIEPVGNSSYKQLISPVRTK